MSIVVSGEMMEDSLLSLVLYGAESWMSSAKKARVELKYLRGL